MNPPQGTRFPDTPQSLSASNTPPHRTIKISLGFLTEAKRRKIAALLQAYRAAVNFYIHSLWEQRGKLDSATLTRLEHSRLSMRYKSQALKQALDVVISTRKAAKVLRTPASIPVFGGGAVLDAKFLIIEDGRHTFDLMFKLSTLKKGQRIWLPCRKTKVLNKWLSRPGAKLIQGCELNERHLVLWVQLPIEKPKTVGSVIGCDIGKNKMLTLSDGRILGMNFSTLCDKVARRKPGSTGKQQAIRERQNYVNRTLNQLPWNDTSVLVVEDLKNLKRGKRRNRNRAFRRKLSPWTYAQVLNRLEHKSEENRVSLVTVPPAYTSQICPICSYRDRDNRHNEMFLCLQCGYSADADIVGARNILARYLGSVKPPNTKACEL